MSLIKVALDDGHGNNTSGKRTPLFEDGSFMKENEFNDFVVNVTRKILEKRGINVIYTAPEKTDTSLTTRVKRANDQKADIFVSAHANAFGSGWNDANGFETFIYSFQSKNSLKLAEYIQKECVKATKLKDRGIKTSADLYVLNSTKMPSVLIECGFMTNKKEAQLLKSMLYRYICSKAIAKGILKYFNMELGDGYLTIEEAKKIIQEACKFDENTMRYLEFYRFADSLIIRLAEAII